MATKKTKNVRLPATVSPIHYKIHIAPDLDGFVFSGEEQITIDVKKKTKEIVLHSAEIEITSATLIVGKKTFKPKISYQEADETATFKFSEEIPADKSTLDLKFTGILNDKMRGFYRSKYNIDGKDYHMGVTQFESTDARRAFPCFDEPAQKATFEVSLRVPSDRTVISNTIETDIAEHDGGYKTVSFAKSPKMSSYLLAYIVGHFEYIKSKTKSGILVRVFVTPGKKKQAEFALMCAVKCIEFYENYFKIPYPLPTMDLIAIPDFAAGAMENWGAVTYRETAVLVDPENSSVQNKQWVALVIAHELAHQWFGNLVTMEWWTHLWLNEGFASFMEYVAINEIYPEWKVWSQFVYIEESRGLALDGLANTHPIEVEVHDPAEISEIFDGVSYSKGASIIRMLAEYLGANKFRDGLRYYLKKHEYSNAATTDLWSALSKISGKPVAKIMNNWTASAGYPLITADQDANGINLSQERFFSSSKHPKDASIWLTPLSILSKGDKKSQFVLLDKKQMKTDIKNKSWFKVNSEETSFARVRYGVENLTKLIEAIPRGDHGLSESDKFGIIRDAFALAEAGLFPTDEAIRLSNAYKKEKSFIVWVQISENILRLKSMFFGLPFYEDFRRFGRELFSDIVKEVGWSKKKGESYETALLRSNVLYAAGALGDTEVINHAKELFKKDVDGESKIEPDIRSVVYNLTAQNGGPAEYKRFLKLYSDVTLEEEKDRIMRALCSFTDIKMLTEMMERSFSVDARGQDAIKAINFIWVNPYGRELAWSTLQEKWPYIVKRFGGGHLFSRFIMPASNFMTDTKADEVEKFFKENPSEGIGRTVLQTVEQIRSNASWIARDSSKVSSFLKSSI
ncbi:MAG TPA: M1 family metallopeptidase [Patescibacteria group bacterium]|nr:M1 family metallopeptidase [Patescibacteria group bacterium]